LRCEQTAVFTVTASGDAGRVVSGSRWASAVWIFALGNRQTCTCFSGYRAALTASGAAPVTAVAVDAIAARAFVGTITLLRRSAISWTNYSTFSGVTRSTSSTVSGVGHSTVSVIDTAFGLFLFLCVPVVCGFLEIVALEIASQRTPELIR